MVVIAGRPARHRAHGPCLALLLLAALGPALAPPAASAQAQAQECLETTSLLPDLWRKLVDSVSTVMASVTSTDEQRRMSALRVHLVDLLVAKRRLSRDLGAFLDAPSDAVWARVSNRLPAVMDSIRDLDEQLRKEAAAGGRLASEPVFKELRTILESRKADVICRLQGPPPSREALAPLRAKLDEEIAAMNAADEALAAALVALRKPKP